MLPPNWLDMSPAATARSRTRSRPTRRRTSSRPAMAGVRWDRVGRVTLLIVLGGILLLYVGPALSYVQTWREANAREAEVRALQREHARLVARRRALREPRSLVREAMKLGMVRRGERAFVVEGLPRSE